VIRSGVLGGTVLAKERNAMAVGIYRAEVFFALIRCWVSRIYTWSCQGKFGVRRT